MIVLPMACSGCGRRIDVLSSEGMPKCPECHGRLRPAGQIRQATKQEEMQGSANIDWDDQLPTGGD